MRLQNGFTPDDLESLFDTIRKKCEVNTMEDRIRSLFKAEGRDVTEEYIALLSSQWEALSKIRDSMDHDYLNDFEIALIHKAVRFEQKEK